MIRRHRSGMVLAGIVVTLLTLGSATPAFAVTMTLPLPPGGPQAAAHHGAAATHIIAASGTPAWQITLIAIAAALVTATGAILLDRARHGIGGRAAAGAGWPGARSGRTRLRRAGVISGGVLSRHRRLVDRRDGLGAACRSRGC